MLSKKQYGVLTNWMYRNARPLDLARWRYHFEGGSSADVVRALEAYQNEDGGFGHALEADCWNPNSAPMQTWWATQFIQEINLDKNHPMIIKILEYLNSGDGFVDNRWLNTTPKNNDYPGAPWWTYVKDSPANLGYNPTVSLAAFILKYANQELGIYSKAKELMLEAVEYFMVYDELIEMHELACFGELAEYLVGTEEENLIDYEAYVTKVKAQIYETIEHDTNKWLTEYCCKPSHFIHHPDSIFYMENKEVMEAELAILLDNLSDDGSWPVTWQWGKDEGEFAISSRWWQGTFGINNVRMLKAFDKLDVI